MRRGDLVATGGAALLVLALAYGLRRGTVGPLERLHRPLELFDGPPEDYAPLEPVTECAPTERPGVAMFRRWVMGALGGSDLGIVRGCGEGGATSKHHEGRARDWGITDQATASAMVSALVAPDDQGRPDALARRAGLRTIIYSREIWKAGQWSPYAGASPHDDHIHFGFGWAGARGETSLYRAMEAGGSAGLLASPGLAENTTEEFRRKAVDLAAGMGLDAGLWLAVMSFETGGTFDPAIRNPQSGAVGLIQFTAKYAPIVVGKTTDELAAMTAVEQLDYVEKWYRYGAAYERIKHPRDYYLTVFAPAGVGQDPGFVLYASPSKAYEQNKAMDADGDGSITVADVSAKFGALVDAAKGRPPVAVGSADQSGRALAAGLALLVAATAATMSQAV